MQPEPKAPPQDPKEEERREKIRGATILWGSVTLGGVVLLAGLAIWHLLRRGRLLREGAAPPRKIEWPEPPLDAEPPTTNRTP